MASVTAIIDVDHNPQAKNELLGGILNLVNCPNCSQQGMATTPLVYHDASKEMLVTYVPTELNMNADMSDRLVGTLVREVTDSMDNKLIKGYVLQPRRALTLQGLVEQVLEADGISREYLDAQKERARLVQMFLQTSPDTYESLVKEHDERLDEQFFQTMNLVAEQYAQQGRPDLGEHVLRVQQMIAQHSTVGKRLLEKSRQQDVAIEAAAKALQSFEKQPTPDEVLAMVRPHAQDELQTQAFVALARPIFDDAFFAVLNKAIEEASADERPHLESMRDRIQALTQELDQHSQSQMQEASNFLKHLLSMKNPEEVIQANIEVIDNTFMTVLDLNIQEATRHNDQEAVAKLEKIQTIVRESLRQQMQPEIRFINDLLEAPTEADATKIMQEQVGQFGAELLEAFDALIELIASQGHQPLVVKLQALRQEAETHIRKG